MVQMAKSPHLVGQMIIQILLIAIGILHVDKMILFVSNSKVLIFKLHIWKATIGGGKANSVQEPSVKCLAVHISKFEILQIKKKNEAKMFSILLVCVGKTEN